MYQLANLQCHTVKLCSRGKRLGDQDPKLLRSTIYRHPGDEDILSHQHPLMVGITNMPDSGGPEEQSAVFFLLPHRPRVLPHVHVHVPPNIAK